MDIDDLTRKTGPKQRVGQSSGVCRHRYRLVCCGIHYFIVSITQCGNRDGRLASWGWRMVRAFTDRSRCGAALTVINFRDLLSLGSECPTKTLLLLESYRRDQHLQSNPPIGRHYRRCPIFDHEGQNLTWHYRTL